MGNYDSGFTDVSFYFGIKFVSPWKYEYTRVNQKLPYIILSILNTFRLFVNR